MCLCPSFSSSTPEYHVCINSFFVYLEIEQYYWIFPVQLSLLENNDIAPEQNSAFCVLSNPTDFKRKYSEKFYITVFRVAGLIVRETSTVLIGLSTMDRITWAHLLLQNTVDDTLLSAVNDGVIT